MSSKYDFVKVKVIVADEHYYVFSRYLLSRMLTFSEIPTLKANTIALELKKALVDGSRLEVPQEDMQRALFQLMADNGFGDRHVGLFRTMTQFYTERVPLVVIIAGTACTGKSTIASALGSRLNNQHIIDGDVMMNALSAASGAPLDDPLWFLDLEMPEVLQEWERRCNRVAIAVAGEVEKALSEGKVLILESALVNIALYAPYVRKAMRNRGIFLSVVVEPPIKKHRNVMVESWLGSRSHFASHLSIPQLQKMVLERFEAVAQLHDEQTASMSGPACTGVVDANAKTASDGDSATTPRSSDGRAPIRVRFEPDNVSRIVDGLHSTLLEQIIPVLKAREEREGGPLES